ncbi:MAG: hypothetical protein V2B18_01555 [Pseudomonadota bacterium]
MDRNLIIHLIRGLLKERTHWVQRYTYWEHCDRALVDRGKRQFEWVFWVINGSNGTRPPITPKEKDDVVRWLRICLLEAVGLLGVRCGKRILLHADVKAFLKVLEGSREQIRDFFYSGGRPAVPGPADVKKLKEFVEKWFNIS